MELHKSFPLKYFKDLVRERTGLTFDSSRDHVLQQKVADVVARKGFKASSELYSLILRQEKEFLDFVNFLTINETYFFREPKYLHLMADHLVPSLLSKRGRKAKLKVISAGCSTGEEPYSIAITLIEKYGAAVSDLFSIIGIDINSVSLKKAAEGIYGKLSFREAEGRANDRYFDRAEGNLFKVKQSVKNLVSFQRFNLLGSQFAGDLSHADIIFYRNVSIYFDAPTQQKILARLASILDQDAYIIFSSAETLSYKDNGILNLVEHGGLFCYQKQHQSYQAAAVEEGGF